MKLDWEQTWLLDRVRDGPFAGGILQRLFCMGGVRSHPRETRSFR